MENKYGLNFDNWVFLDCITPNNVLDKICQQLAIPIAEVLIDQFKKDVEESIVFHHQGDPVVSFCAEWGEVDLVDFANYNIIKALEEGVEDGSIDAEACPDLANRLRALADILDSQKNLAK